MSDIKTWRERCETHPDHQGGIITEGMIQARIREEVEDLRAEVERLTQGTEVSRLRAEVERLRKRCDWMLHNGGTWCDEWPKEWVPGLHGPLILWLSARIDAALAPTVQPAATTYHESPRCTHCGENRLFCYEQREKFGEDGKCCPVCDHRTTDNSEASQ